MPDCSCGFPPRGGCPRGDTYMPMTIAQHVHQHLEHVWGIGVLRGETRQSVALVRDRIRTSMQGRVHVCVLMQCSMPLCPHVLVYQCLCAFTCPCLSVSMFVWLVSVCLPLCMYACAHACIYLGTPSVGPDTIAILPRRHPESTPRRHPRKCKSNPGRVHIDLALTPSRPGSTSNRRGTRIWRARWKAPAGLSGS